LLDVTEFWDNFLPKRLGLPESNALGGTIDDSVDIEDLLSNFLVG
jgi:hypothetical protein